MLRLKMILLQVCLCPVAAWIDKGFADCVFREAQGLVWRWLILRGGWFSFNCRPISLIFRTESIEDAGHAKRHHNSTKCDCQIPVCRSHGTRTKA